MSYICMHLVYRYIDINESSPFEASKYFCTNNNIFMFFLSFFCPIIIDIKRAIDITLLFQISIHSDLVKRHIKKEYTKPIFNLIILKMRSIFDIISVILHYIMACYQHTIINYSNKISDLMRTLFYFVVD